MIGALQVYKKLVVKVVLLLSALYSQFSAKLAEQATNSHFLNFEMQWLYVSRICYGWFVFDKVGCV
jgi:hypothetical protein